MSTLSVPDRLRTHLELKRVPNPASPPEGQIHISAPGRICLFGEHQDYLGLPVIAAAIDLRVAITASPNTRGRINVELPDIDETLELHLDETQPYRHDRDYLPAGFNVLHRLGIRWQSGWDVVVRGDIPVNAGASSSSALQVAWIAFLLAAAGQTTCASDPLSVALLAHRSEVVEFNSPGGTMDHFTSAFGGMIWLDPATGSVEQLNPWPGEFVLVNSGIPKDTNGLLGSTRARVEKLESLLAAVSPDASDPDIQSAIGAIQNPADRTVFSATIHNRMLTPSARRTLKETTDSRLLGDLLNRHHRELVKLGVSHPEIDRLLLLGGDYGALGGKINGSGGGGSFFVLAPGRGELVQDFYEALGLQAMVVRIGNGVSVSYQQKHELVPGRK